MALQAPSGSGSRVLKLLAAETAALARIDAGEPLGVVLSDLLLAVEAASPVDLRCSVLRCDEAGRHLFHLAAPSLPDAYNAAIDGTGIREGAGSCGTAAHRGEPVHVADIATDPLWADFRDLALQHGLRACWSQPIRAGGHVVATFACYYGTPREPEIGDLEAVALVSRAVCQLIERDRDRRSSRDHTERLALALDTAQLGTWEYRPDEGRLIWSAALFRLYGRDPAQGDPDLEGWRQLIHPEDRALAFTPTEASGQLEREYRIRRADGEERWLLSRSRLIRGDGGPLRFVGISLDVTEAKKTEAALRDSEARFHAIANSIDQMIWSTLPDGSHDYYNDRWYEFTGVPPGSTDGEAWNGMFHPDDQDRAWSIWRHSLQTGAPYHIEYRLRHRSGEYRWVIGRAQCVRDAAGAIARWYGTCTDIHDLKTAEARLAQLAAVVEQSRDFIGVADVEGHPVYVNDAGRAMMGLATLEAACALPLLDYFVEADRARIAEQALPAAANDGYWEGEASFRRFDDGRAFPVLYNLFPVRDDHGRITHFATVTRNLTEKKTVEGELRRLNASLETRVAEQTLEAREAMAKVIQLQKLESLGQLTGGVAHDFNNLLTPVLGALDMVDRKIGASDDRLHRVVTGAMEAAERAKTLVQRLLAFARKQHLEPRAVDVAALVKGMDDLIRRSLGSRIETVIDTPASLDLVRVDPSQLELSILNLAVNARDAMPQGGRLTVSARMKSVAVPNDLGLTAGDYVRLRVTDTGHGMDAETARMAIEPFYTTKGVGKGTGLGLSMAHGLAAQSGGTLRIRSEPGEGTTVEMWLPVTLSTARALAETAAEVTPASRPLSILVVDDEELVRSLTASMLEEMGHSVIEASGGARAIEHLRTRPEIELMLTDFLMPGQTGVELARDAKRVRADLPILLMTGYADLAEGADGGLPRLAKPFRAAELAARIDELVAQPRPVALRK